MTAIALAALFLPTGLLAPTASAAPGAGWNMPVYLESSTDDVWAIDFAADRSGNAMAVWQAYDGSYSWAWARYFKAGEGWQPAVKFGGGQWAASPAVAMDPMGNAAVVFMDWNGTGYNVSIARYSPEWGWETQRNYTGMPRDPWWSVAAMDGASNLYLAMRVYNSSTGYLDIYGLRQDPSGAVSLSPRLDVGRGTWNVPAIGAGALQGAVIALMDENASGLSNLSVVRHTPASGWSTAQVIDDQFATAYNPAVAVDDAGNAMVAWEQSNVLRWSRYTAGGNWTAPVLLFGGATAYGVDLHTTPAGYITASGVASIASAYRATFARYTPGVGWSASIPAPEAAQTYPRTQLALDERGQGALLYAANSGGYALPRGAQIGGLAVGARGFAEVDSSTYSIYDMRAASLGEGRALAVWQEYDGARYNVRSNLWALSDTMAPNLAVDRPFNGTSYGGAYARVNGTAEPYSQVTVNGATTIALPNGTFEVFAPIMDGLNTLQARATDAAGNVNVSTPRLVVQNSQAALIASDRAQIGRQGWQDIQRFDNVSFPSGAGWNLAESDAAGNVFAVWYQYHYNWGIYMAYGARYANGTGWSVAELLRTTNGGNGLCDEAALAVSPQGNAVFVWSEYNVPGSGYCVAFVREWRAGAGWMEPFRVDNATFHAYQPDAAAAADGQLAITWRQDEGGGSTSVAAMIWDPSTGWGNRTRLSTLPNVTHVPSIAFDASGTAYVTAAWRISNTYDRIVLYNHTRGGTWTNGTVIETLGSTINSPASVASDAGGNLTLAYLERHNSTSTQYDTKAGRIINGTWTGNQSIWNNSWTWYPEVIVDGQGRGYVAQTETTGTANSVVAVAPRGGTFGAAVRLDNTTYHDGGPRLSLTTDRQAARVSWDSIPPGGRWHALWSEYSPASGNWSSPQRINDLARDGNIPVLAPMPDGGMMAVFLENDPVSGVQLVVGRRFVPYETVPPVLIVTAPTNGFTVNVSSVRVTGVTEPGAAVTVNGVAASVAPDGSFAVDVPLINGTNPIYIRATDAAGNGNATWRNGTFVDPDRVRIEQLEALNAALQDQLNLTNASLWTAITGMNASLLAELAAQNASLAAAILAGDMALVAELAAQNASIQQALGDLNASLLADLAAQSATLAAAIAAGDAALLAELAAQNASLLDTLADLNASLLAELAAQNADLVAQIAATNASLLAELIALDDSLTGALADLNQTLLAQMAAEDAALAQLIADTNVSLLASLAAQNDDLLARLGATNASLLAQLASTNATLWAKLTADNGALWSALNLTNDEVDDTQATNSNVNAGQNQTLADAQSRANAAQEAAASAGTMALLGLFIGVVGAALGAISFLMWRRRPPQMEPNEAPPPRPVVESVEVVDALAATPPGGKAASHGHSMGAEGELGSGEA